MMPLRFFLLLWPVIDGLLTRCYHIRPLRTQGSGIICVELRRYKGHAIILGDGSEVKAGNTILELHLNGAWFRKRRKSSVKASHLPWEILNCFAKDLGLLAEQIVNGMFSDITALHASTILHVGARRLGFQVRELPNTLWKKCAQFYLSGLMQVYHLQGGERLKVRGKPLELKEVWLSKAELLRRYGPRHL